MASSVWVVSSHAVPEGRIAQLRKMFLQGREPVALSRAAEVLIAVCHALPAADALALVRAQTTTGCEAVMISSLTHYKAETVWPVDGFAAHGSLEGVAAPPLPKRTDSTR